MPAKSKWKTTSTSTVQPAGRAAAVAPPADSRYVQRGHTVTTVRETERCTKTSKSGKQSVKTKTRTVYYIDGKPVRLNWFDKLRIGFMSSYEKQAFLAEKLLKQEKKDRERARRLG